MKNIIEQLEILKSSAIYLNWIHPLIRKLTPSENKPPHGLSLHAAMEVVKKNGLIITGHRVLGNIEIIETVKK